MASAKYCRVFPLDTFPAFQYVVVFSRMNGQWLFSRHKERQTWETQGGHIEPGETPLEAAKRELYEESGAKEFTIVPVCDYWAGSDEGSSVGAVFLAEIAALGQMPESEMAEARAFDTLPENVTYPAITPMLFEETKALIKRAAASSAGPEGVSG